MKHTRSFSQMTGLGLAALLVVSCAASPTPVPTATPVAPTETSAPPTPVPTATPVAPTETSTAPPPQPTATVAPPTATPPPATPTADRTPLPPPITAEFPTGTFFHEHAGPLAGTYCVFQFNEDGTYAYYYLVDRVDVSGKTPLFSGTYVIDRNLYTETSATMSSAAYPPCDFPGPYAWTYDGEILEFQVVGEDPCSERLRTYESPLKYARAE